MSATTQRPRERLGFAAVVLLTLAPVVLQGLWRPLAWALHAEADSSGVTGAALVVATVALIACAATFGRAANRWLPGASACLAVVPLGLLLGKDLPASGAVMSALLGVAVFCGALLRWLVRRLPEEMDGLAARRKGVTALMLLLYVVTVTIAARLSVFMGDSTRPDLSLAPGDPFLTTHSCLTAYVQGSRLAADGVENLYDPELWPHMGESARARANGAPYAPFSLDTYVYPPPFLLLPRVLLTPLDHFASQRALWFAVNGLWIAFGLWTVATWIGGRTRLYALLIAPVLWQPTLGTLQIGNVHAFVVVAAMLALVAFDTRRPALGGALLAFAVVSKISPGLLVVVLLLQRRFRELLWTAGWGLGFALLGLAVFGVAPYETFLSYELPRLRSGEALAFLAWPEVVPINFAPFGIPFKLASIGVDIGDPWAVARAINQVFTVALLALVVLAARKVGGPRAQAVLWAAVLTLSSLCSPLAPIYVLFSLLWLLSLRAAEVRGTIQITVAVLLLIGVTIPIPGWGTPQVILSLIQQGLAAGATAYFLLRKPSIDDDSRPGEAPRGPGRA